MAAAAAAWAVAAAPAAAPGAEPDADLEPAPTAAPIDPEASLAALHRCFLQQVRHHHRTHAMASPAAGGRPPGTPRGAQASPAAASAASIDVAPSPPGAPPWSAPPSLDARPGAPTARHEHAPLGPAAELYFFDQLADSERELGGPARLLWCRPWFSGPYLRAHHTLSRRSRVARPVPHPEAAPRRLHHFDHHNDATRVLRAAAHAGGHHPTAEHASAALEALAAHGGGPTPLDADWLALTTSLPDLYLFEAPHAHALTPDTGEQVGAAQAERARGRFVEHVRQTVARAHGAERAGDHARALLYVGVASHALLDLCWHRGMTEAELAALTFVRHAPPHTTLSPARQATAEQALQNLFARVWPAGDAAEVRWRDEAPPPPRSRALAQAMAEAYPHAREVDYAALLRRYQAGHALVAGGRDGVGASELAGALAGRWDVAATLREVWREDGEPD